MSTSKGELEARRQELAEKIFRQRIELANAYRDLAKPLAYTQKAIVGAQMLKKNAWLIALMPTAVNLGFSFFGWKKPSRTGIFGISKRTAEREARKEAESAKRPLLRLAGHGWRLFKIYRRVRRFLP